jgi:hypothetical protein
MDIVIIIIFLSVVFVIAKFILSALVTKGRLKDVELNKSLGIDIEKGDAGFTKVMHTFISDVVAFFAALILLILSIWQIRVNKG